MSQANIIKKRRNIWTKDEVIFFLNLIKEKKILAILDGKKFRSSEIFKSLEKPMKDATYSRDWVSMQIKFKNLKVEYYKNIRQNSVSGAARVESEFFHLLHDIFGDRPASQLSGYESTRKEEEASEDESANTVNVDVIEECIVSSDGEVIPFVSGDDNSEKSNSSCGTTPSRRNLSQVPSRAHSLQEPSTSRGHKFPRTPKKKTTAELSIDRLVAIEEEMKETFKNTAENIRIDAELDRELMESILNRQEMLIRSCTRELVNGIKSLKKRRRSSTDSDSD